MFRIEAVGDGAPVLSSASHPRSRIEGAVLANGDCARARRMTVRGRLLGGVLHHAIAEGVVQLIHIGAVVGGLARSAAFENHDGEPGARGNLLGQCEADKTAAGDYDIDGLELLHGVWETSLHGFRGRRYRIEECSTRQNAFWPLSLLRPSASPGRRRGLNSMRSRWRP